MSIAVKRIYEPAAPEDGYRVLVDRIWPRGLSKERAAVDEWLKEVAPTTELRRWFDHVPERWPEFRKRYAAELESHEDALTPLRKRARRGKITLLFGAKEERYNNAVALKAFLSK